LHKIPSQHQINILIKSYQSQNYKKTKQLAILLTKKFPHHVLGWKVLSMVLKRKGEIKESLKAILKIIEITPEDAEAYYNLGNTLRELGKFEEAKINYIKAISLNPNFSEVNYNLGIVFKELGKFEEAEIYYKRAIKLKPNFSSAYNNLGTVLEHLGKPEEAEKFYRQAISLEPNQAEFYNNLGTVLEQIGKIKEAKINFEKSIKINPGFANAHRQLSQIKKFKKYDEQYFTLQKIYLDKKTSKDQLCHINFSLAKINEDLGNFSEAFKHYNEGNSIRKKLLNYNIEEDIKLFKKIKLNYYQILKQEIRINKNEINFKPIFILGMPRSGTTLIEQIISSHPEVSALGELPFVYEFGKSITNGLTDTNKNSILKFRNLYIKKIQNLSKENSFITDKMPQNFCYIGLIINAFPEAKILHIKRNPAAVCWANFRQWFRSKDLAYSYSIDDIIRYYSLYEDIMTFWKKEFNESIYEIDYEILINDQKNIIKKLISHLNLKWDEKCLSPENNKRSVSTASNIQIRNKIFKGSSEKWKSYKPFLKGAFNVFD
tara:strand:+ start:461 stop:2098 length:1638 start_codon:yes stop_codon:yes gene_type:complete